MEETPSEHSWRDEKDPLGPPEAPPEEEAAAAPETTRGDNAGVSGVNWRKIALVAIPLLLVVVLATTLGIVFGSGKKDELSPEEKKRQQIWEIIAVPLYDGSGGVYYLHNSTAERIQSNSSAQWRAREFLYGDGFTSQLLKNLSTADEKSETAEVFSIATQIRERYALATMYYGTGGEGWTENGNWLSPEHHHCDWYSSSPGASNCQNNLYEMLLLPQNNLQGQLPAELFYYLLLYLVDFSFNALGGPLKDFGRFLWESTIHLDLHNNWIEGTLDDLPFSSSYQLRNLWLWGNVLTGAISTQIGSLGELERLGLNYNFLSGAIPSELGSHKLNNLQEIYLHNNRLNGTIPLQVAKGHPELKHMWLHNNQLTGSIPGNLGGNSTALETLFLANNQLNGSIPTGLLNLGALVELDFSNNALTGTLWTELGGMGNLTVFRLANNSLSGILPSQLAQLSNLQVLDLMGNDLLEGSLPPLLCNISTLDVNCSNICGCFCGPCPNTLTSAANVSTGALGNFKSEEEIVATNATDTTTD